MVPDDERQVKTDGLPWQHHHGLGVAPVALTVGAGGADAVVPGAAGLEGHLELGLGPLVADHRRGKVGIARLLERVGEGPDDGAPGDQVVPVPVGVVNGRQGRGGQKQAVVPGVAKVHEVPIAPEEDGLLPRAVVRQGVTRPRHGLVRREALGPVRPVPLPGVVKVGAAIMAPE